MQGVSETLLDEEERTIASNVGWCCRTGHWSNGARSDEDLKLTISDDGSTNVTTTPTNNVNSSWG